MNFSDCFNRAAKQKKFAESTKKYVIRISSLKDKDFFLMVSGFTVEAKDFWEALRIAQYEAAQYLMPVNIHSIMEIKEDCND